MKAHSPFGGSQASRYMACPGSVALAERAPAAASSEYADEGTFAHALAEVCLNAGIPDAMLRVGTEVEHPSIASTKVVTEEMAKAVNVYLEAVWSEYDLDPASEIEVEHRFSIPVDAAEEGEVFGTNDCVVYSPARRKLTLFDYKHGAGVIVEVEDNTQLKFYAIGAIKGHPEWDVREIELVVVQPRAFNAGDAQGVKRWSLPMVEVIEFPYELNEAIKLAKAPDAPLVAGEHCRFCPASAICTVREQEFVNIARNEFSGVDIGIEDLADDVAAQPDNYAYDFERAAKIVEAYERLGPWINDLRQAMDNHLLAGGQIPGWKVVEAVARRKWTSSDEEIASYLALMHDVPEELSRPRSIVTITEAKRLLKSFVPKDQYAEAEKELTLRFTTKESKGLVTAPESDKRAAIQPVAAEFGSVMLGAE